MRLIRLSLAAKYRLLFGLAVLLILAAALSVPWTLGEYFVQWQPFREAQRLADEHFHLAVPEPAGSTVGTIHGRSNSLLPEPVRLTRAPQFVRFALDAEDPDSIVSAQTHPFVDRAFRAFAANPKRANFWQEGVEQGQQQFYLAQPVRVAKSCLQCHDEGRQASVYQEGQLAGLLFVAIPTTASQVYLAYFRLWLVVAGLLAGFLAILVFYVITRQFILSPIHALREVAARVTAGDLNVRAHLTTGDEFEQLSDSLNAMLTRLRDSQEDLRKANVALDQKLGEMAETNVALYEANKLKSEFLANVTHELRTPLTGIIGFAELLREGVAVDPASKPARYAENILISGRILLEIINDLLDLAKIEANRIEVRPEPVALHELCGTLIEFMRPLAEKKALRLESDVEADLPLVRTDRGRLRQILYNLLSNALKFTPADGSVHLSAARLGHEHVILSVTDTGPGIAPEHQALIFDKFRQVDQSATRQHHGTGLGLAIARELTHLLGGKIGVKSELGHGATFWISLPLELPEGVTPLALSLSEG